MKTRKDAGCKADSFFDSLPEALAPLARALRNLVLETIPEASESIKWGMPVYETSKLVCALRPSNTYIALQFYESGTSLADPDGLLEGTGKKMRHMKIRKQADIKRRLLKSWIRQAAA